jgi:hypothetical protein
MSETKKVSQSAVKKATPEEVEKVLSYFFPGRADLPKAKPAVLDSSLNNEILKRL